MTPGSLNYKGIIHVFGNLAVEIHFTRGVSCHRGSGAGVRVCRYEGAHGVVSNSSLDTQPATALPGEGSPTGTLDVCHRCLQDIMLGEK